MAGLGRSTGRRLWPVLRLVAGAVILAVLAWRLGAGPFRAGVRRLDAGTLVLAAGITVATTVCSAWRWRLVATGLGARLSLASAVAAYYRSQFLNTTLPGGVLGDLHRGLRHGRDAGDLGVGLRAVAWERAAGQAVQVLVAVALLAVLPSPARPLLPLLGGLALLLLAGFALLARSRRRPGVATPEGGDPAASRWVRAGRLLRTEAATLAARRVYPGIVVASALVVAGHTAIFLLAVHATGTRAPLARLLPLALLVLLAMAVPANLGGWGPREGVAAWAFGAAGLGAAAGLAAAVAYGVLVLVACLPGALVLLVGAVRTRRAGPPPAEPARPREDLRRPAVVGG